MCKFCELGNPEIIVDTDDTFLFISNYTELQPKIIYGGRIDNKVSSYSLPVNFCPICGRQLVDYENMKLVEEY